MAKITDEQRKTIDEMMKAGEPNRIIAEATGVNIDYIRGYRLVVGVPSAVKPGRAPVEIDWPSVVDRLNAGETCSDVAYDIGISATHLHTRMAKTGIRRVYVLPSVTAEHIRTNTPPPGWENVTEEPAERKAIVDSWIASQAE